MVAPASVRPAQQQDGAARGDQPVGVEDQRGGVEAAAPLQLSESNGRGAASSSLTFAALETRALQSHPLIANARAQLEAARGQALQAGLPFNPQFQYQAEEIGSGGHSGLHWTALSQQIVTANKLQLAQQVQLQNVRQRQAKLARARLQVLTRLRIEYAQTLVAQQRLQLNRRLNALANRSVEAVQSLYAAEEVSKIDVLQARVESSQARIGQENAAAELRAQRRALAAAAGLPELPTSELSGEIEAVLPEQPWELWLEEIASASPELAAAGARLERARWSLQLACAQVVPNVTAQLGVGFDDGSDDPYALVGLSVPLPLRNRNQGNIRAARARIAAAEAEIESTQLDLARRLAAAIGRYQVARERYLRLGDTVLSSAEETYELSRQAFEAGEANFLQLLTTQRTLFNIQLSVLDAAGEAMNAKAEIEGLLVATTD
jgi:cobalt-zinc-cadmium efflux system outer membrane protein